MKHVILVPVVLLLGLASGHALANLKLAEEKQCLQCHAVDRDTIGPSFQKIGAVYRTMKNPEKKLIDVMRLGSAAHLGPMWGSARMPDMSERPEINDREAKALARWILSDPH